MFASRGKVCCIVDLENFFIGKWRKARCVSISVKYRNIELMSVFVLI